MSETSEYLPFHRKYRPKTYMEFVGNDGLKRSVMSALRAERRPQVLLFTGPAGSGKTTNARLLAKEYRCENRDPNTGACGHCHSCIEMDEYIESGDDSGLMNVREIDVTDSSGKASISDLLEDAAIPAFGDEWKVYILDECHMLTNAAQNRLLKNLEEPAENVLMILCTTDPQKLIDPVKTRCQYKFKVQKPNLTELGNLLARICETEKVSYEPKALSVLCAKGDFVPRSTLIELQKVVDAIGEVSYEQTLKILQITRDTYLFDFYKYLLDDSVNTIKYINFLGKLKVQMNLKDFVDALVPFTMRGIYIINGTKVEGLDESEINQYRRLFSKFGVGDVAYILSILLDMQKEIDVEARLMLLGYTGIRRPTPQTQGVGAIEAISLTSNLLESKETVGAEKKESDERYLESVTPTEEDKKKFADVHSQPVSASALASAFKGTTIDISKVKK